MNYDGTKLNPPDNNEVVAVWDDSSKPGYLGSYRWLVKTKENLYLYWCKKDPMVLKDIGDWHSVPGDRTWENMAKDISPVWTLETKTVESTSVTCSCDSQSFLIIGGCPSNRGLPCRSQ